MRDAALSAMPALKVLAACSSVAAGAAAVCLVGYMQSDSLAFTRPNVHELRNVDPPRFAPRPDPSEHPVQLDEMLIEGRIGVRPLVAAIEPCTPGWRDLLMGPAGRKVRSLCPDGARQSDQPRGVAGKAFVPEKRVSPKSPHGELGEPPITRTKEFLP